MGYKHNPGVSGTGVFYALELAVSYQLLAISGERAAIG
jgi:hypothetical protein